MNHKINAAPCVNAGTNSSGDGAFILDVAWDDNIRSDPLRQRTDATLDSLVLIGKCHLRTMGR